MEVLKWLLFFAIAMFLMVAAIFFAGGPSAADSALLADHHRSGFVLIRNPMTPMTPAMPYAT